MGDSAKRLEEATASLPLSLSPTTCNMGKGMTGLAYFTGSVFSLISLS